MTAPLLMPLVLMVVGMFEHILVVGILAADIRMFHLPVAIAVAFFLHRLLRFFLRLLRFLLRLVRPLLGLRFFLGRPFFDGGGLHSSRLAFEILLEHRRKAAAAPRPAQRSGQSLPTGEERKGLRIA
ncbi:hypothetical protein ASE60_33285 [Ensifer sp. Root278]|nr:hypothetical protein ASE60_33285 [Ensifer sp. Root278]